MADEIAERDASPSSEIANAAMSSLSVTRKSSMNSPERSTSPSSYSTRTGFGSRMWLTPQRVVARYHSTISTIRKPACTERLAIRSRRCLARSFTAGPLPPRCLRPGAGRIPRPRHTGIIDGRAEAQPRAATCATGLFRRRRPQAVERIRPGRRVDSVTALRISANLVQEAVKPIAVPSVVNFSDVMKAGLRGCGSSISMISLMVPGRAENTATRSARNTASPRL